MKLPHGKASCLYWLSIPVLFGCFFLAGYLAVRPEAPLDREPGRGEPGEPAEEQASTMVAREGIPLRMSQVTGTDQVIYKLRGEMDGGLVINPDYNGRIEGVFRLAEDPLERRFQLLTGFPGSLYLGEYEGSFEATSSWKLVANPEAVEKINAGRGRRAKNLAPPNVPEPRSTRQLSGLGLANRQF